MDIQFWTADDEGNNLNSIGFYACFVNWCHQQVGRVRIPGTKFESEADKARSQNLWDVLRERPLDMRAFIGLMDDYAKRQYADGDKLGYIRAPEKADSETLAMGHRRLKQIVWTQAERMTFAIVDGSDWGLTGNVRRRVERARQGKLNAISAAAEERQSAHSRAFAGFVHTDMIAALELSRLAELDAIISQEFY